MLIIVTGVSGTGKTTLGRMISSELQILFLDADDFHPEDNVKKMSQGIPLVDSDRLPWLKLLADKLNDLKGGSAVLACSALKESYRKLLSGSNEVVWIHLYGSKTTIMDRMRKRSDHYMKASMLSSQIEIWERPAKGLILPISNALEENLQKSLDYIDRITTAH